MSGEWDVLLRTVLSLIEYSTYRQEKDEELQKLLVLFSLQALHLWSQMQIVKYFALQNVK